MLGDIALNSKVYDASESRGLDFGSTVISLPF